MIKLYNVRPSTNSQFVLGRTLLTGRPDDPLERSGLDLLKAVMDLVRPGMDLVRAGMDLVCVGMDLVRAGMDLVRAGMDLVRAGMDLGRAGMDLGRAGMDPVKTGMDLGRPLMDLATCLADTMYMYRPLGYERGMTTSMYSGVDKAYEVRQCSAQESYTPVCPRFYVFLITDP